MKSGTFCHKAGVVGLPLYVLGLNISGDRRQKTIKHAVYSSQNSYICRELHHFQKNG